MQNTKLVVITSNTFIYGEVCDYTVGFEYDPDYSVPASTDNFTFTLTSAGLPTITIGPLPINPYYTGTIPYCVAGISKVLLFPPGTYTLHVTSDFRLDEYYNAPPDLYKTIVINPGKAIIVLTPSENPTTPTQLETITAYILPSAAGQPVGNIDFYYLDTNINPSAYVQIGPTATFNSSNKASSSSTLPPSTTQGKTATWPIYYYYYNDPNFAPIGTSDAPFLSDLSIIIYPPSTYIILDTNPTTGLVYSEPFEVSATLTGFNPNAKLSIGWPTLKPPTPYFTYNLNTLGTNNAIEVGSSTINIPLSGTQCGFLFNYYGWFDTAYIYYTDGSHDSIGFGVYYSGFEGYGAWSYYWGGVSIAQWTETNAHGITARPVYFDTNTSNGEVWLWELVWNAPTGKTLDHIVLPTGCNIFAISDTNGIVDISAHFNANLIVAGSSTNYAYNEAHMIDAGLIPNFTTPASSTLGTTAGLCGDSLGGIYVCNPSYNEVLYYQFDSNNDPILKRTITANNNLYTPVSVAIDPSGNVYAVDAEPTYNGGFHGWISYAPAGGTIFTNNWALSSDGTQVANVGVNTIAFDSAGTFYACVGNKINIYNFFDPLVGGVGRPTTTLGDGGTHPYLSTIGYAAGVYVDAEFNVYVLDSKYNRLLFFPYESTVATKVWGQTIQTIGGILGTTPSPTSSTTWNVVELSSDSLQPAWNNTTTIGGFTVDPGGNVFVVDSLDCRVLFYPYSTLANPTCAGVIGQNNLLSGVSIIGTASTMGEGTSTTFNYPTGICCDSSGNVYIADSLNNRVCQFAAIYHKVPIEDMTFSGPELSDIIFNPVTAVMTGYTAYTEATDADVGNTLITASYPAGDPYFLPGTGNKIVNVIACPTTTTTPSAAVWAVNSAGTISASVVAQTPGQGLINEGYIFFWTDSLSSSGVSGIIPLGYGAVQSGVASNDTGSQALPFGTYGVGAMYVDNKTDWGTITEGTSGGSISGTGTSNGSIYPSGKGPGAPSTGLGGNYSSSASATAGTLSVRYVATIQGNAAPDNPVYSEPVIISILVSGKSGQPVPQGTVAGYVNGALIGSPGNISGGSCQITSTIIPGGDQSVSLVFSANDNVYTNSSGSVEVNVSPANTSTTITMTPLPSADSSGNPVYSQSTTLKATIAAQGGQGCTATPGANTTSVTSSDASDFWTGVLNGLGAPVSTNNILVLNTWSSREAAPSWATWNPLDSTQGQGSPGNSSGVLAYSSQADGISYTWQTIDNPNYPAIKAALIADTDITIWQETSGGNGLIGTELMTWSNNGYSYLPASNPTFVSNALVNTTQVLSQPISSVDFTYDDGSGSSPIPLGTAAIVNGVGSYTLPLIYGGMFNSNSKGTITATYEDNSDWSGSSADWSSFVLDGCPTVCSTPLFSQSPTTYNMPVTITAFVTAGSPGTVTPGTPNELITGNNAGELAPVETISFYDGSPLVGNLLNAQQAYFAGDAIGGAPSGYNISPTQNIGKIDSTYSNTSLCANSLMVTCKINGLITITSQPKTPILPGTPYVILADIYTPAVRSGATATIGCNFYDSSGNIISGSYSSSPFTLVAASWNYLSYICLSTPANAYEAVITVLIPSATTSDSSYWIDCLSIASGNDLSWVAPNQYCLGVQDIDNTGTAYLVPTITLPLGTHPIYAVYNGDPNYLPSPVSATADLLITYLATATIGTITVVPEPSYYGENVTFTVGIT